MWSMNKQSETFLQLGRSSQYLAPYNSETILAQKISLSGEGFEYLKEYHSFIDFLALMGGVTYSTYCLIGMLIGPIQRHSYKMRAIKRLYFARSEKNIFVYDLKKEESVSPTTTFDKQLNQQIDHEISKHERISFQFGSWFNLLFGCNSNKTHQTIYKEGQKRVMEETNLVEIVKNLRYH